MSITSAIKKMVARQAGPNRANRRAQAKLDAGKEKRERKELAEKAYDDAKAKKRERIRAKHQKAHEKAVKRQEYAKKHGLKHTQVTNEMIGIKK